MNDKKEILEEIKFYREFLRWLNNYLKRTTVNKDIVYETMDNIKIKINILLKELFNLNKDK